jgi:HK97 family phage portal protein
MFKLFKRVKNIITGTSSETSITFALGIPQYFSQSYRNYVIEGYAKNPTLFACLDLIARSVGDLKWVLYEGDEESPDRKLITSHPLLTLIRRTDPRLSKSEFFARMVLHLYLEGDAFNFINAPAVAKNLPRELNLLRPDRVSSEKLSNGETLYKYLDNFGRQIIYREDQIIRHSFYNPLDDYNGFSPLSPLAHSTDVNNASRRWNYSLLRHALVLSAWFEVDGDLGTNKEIIEQKIREKYAGFENIGKPMVLSGGLKPKQGTFSPRDMDWLNGITQSAEEIMEVLHVPSELLGKSKTFENFENARKHFMAEVILPLAKQFRDNYNHSLSPRFGENLFLDIDTTAIQALQEDADKKHTRIRANYTSGLITLTEARSEIGYKPLEPGQETELYQQPLGFSSESDRSSETADTDVELQDEEKTNDMEHREKDSKSFSPEEKVRRRRRFELVENYRKRFSRELLKNVRREFRYESKKIFTAISGASESTAVPVLENLVKQEFEPRWRRMLTQFYRQVIQTIGQQEWRELQDLAKSRLIGGQVKQEFDPYSDAISNQIRFVVGKHIANITATTVKLVRMEIYDGIRLGKSIPEIADAVREMYDTNMTLSRAEMIARTETISTTNFAGQETAKQSGLPLKKEWISTRDGRTRGSDPDDKFNHLDMNGKQQRLSEAYLVSGEKMMFPGDTSMGASPGNVVNCRCAEAYVVADDA